MPPPLRILLEWEVFCHNLTVTPCVRWRPVRMLDAHDTRATTQLARSPQPHRATLHVMTPERETSPCHRLHSQTRTTSTPSLPASSPRLSGATSAPIAVVASSPSLATPATATPSTSARPVAAFGRPPTV